MVAFSNFYGKNWVGFCLNIRKRFFLEFSFQSQQKEHKFFYKNGTRDFRNSPPFDRSACFDVTISESLKDFQYFDFETNFLEKENWIFKNVQKTGVLLFNWNH